LKSDVVSGILRTYVRFLTALLGVSRPPKKKFPKDQPEIFFWEGGGGEVGLAIFFIAFLGVSR
jgi:hypothetical protein